MNRRGFFKSIGGKTISVAGKALEMNASEEADEFIYDVHENQKRNLLLKITERLYCEDRIDLNSKVSFSSGDIHFGEVSINSSSCIGCKVCVTLCPSGALKAKEDETGLSIHLTRGLCINCGLCADACQQKAIKVAVPEKVEDALGLGIMVEENESLILEKQKKVCLTCELPFYTKGDCCINCLNMKEKKDIIHQNILSMEVEE
jgi:Pyruvate/2-oxoacid:ferredoxin oxidoreductase delta subunit